MKPFNRVTLPIRYKLLLSFTAVMIAGLLSLILVSVRITEHNVSRLINHDIIQVKKTIDLYMKQYFLTKNETLNRESFHVEADGLVKELSTAVGGPISIFDGQGNALSAFNAALAPLTDDFSQALEGLIAYSINHAGSSSSVGLSSPVEADGSLIGIIYFVKDYSELNHFTESFLTTIKWFAIAILALVFLTAVWLSRRITRPIDRLARGVKQVSEGIYETIPLNRDSDEIDALSRAFNLMVEKIEEQIATIERERDALKKTQAMSKTFFDNVTHELKTPLTTIRGYAQIMEENGFTDKKFFDKGVQYIIEESKRLNDKVVQILAYSAAEAESIAYHFKPVELIGLIRSSCEDMSVKARKYGITIQYPSKGELYVRGDPVKLREMLVNVVDNAIKYGGVDTAVTVSAERADNGSVRIHVTDQGPGIPEEHLEHLFEPFYRLAGNKKEEERGSAGLGLAIVKTIAKRHGGKVSVRSVPGGGTSLSIELGGDPCA